LWQKRKWKKLELKKGVNYKNVKNLEIITKLSKPHNCKKKKP
jgi:hypothetical protein